MPTGRIKYYNFDKGFGFIAQDSSDTDVFLHSSAIKHPDYEELRVGQRVKYNIVEGEKGLVAQNVEVLLTPTERRWLRQGKAIIPRGYSGFPGQGQFLAEEEPIPSDAGGPSIAVRETTKPRSRLKTDTPVAVESTKQQVPRSTGSSRRPAEQSSKQLSFGDLYILKQINFETAMFFALYRDVQLPAIVLEMTLTSLTLNSNGNEQVIIKTDVKYCYKDMDAEKVQASVEIDEAVKARKLAALQKGEEGYLLDAEAVQNARKRGDLIEVTLREGEIFRGIIDWVSPYEIKLILNNGAKVVLFQHALYELKVL